MNALVLSIITLWISVHVILANPYTNDVHIVIVHIDHKNHTWWIWNPIEDVNISMIEYGDDLEAFTLIYDIVNEITIDTIENDRNAVIIVVEKW